MGQKVEQLATNPVVTTATGSALTTWSIMADIVSWLQIVGTIGGTILVLSQLYLVWIRRKEEVQRNKKK